MTKKLKIPANAGKVNSNTIMLRTPCELTKQQSEYVRSLRVNNKLTFEEIANKTGFPIE